MSNAEWGAIPRQLAEDVSLTLKRKFNVQTGFKPVEWNKNIKAMTPLPEKTVSGSVVAFSDGADDVPLKSCAVTIAPTLDGVSSVDVVHGGKNFVDDTLAGLEQGSISSGTGLNASSDTRVRTADYIPFPLDKIQPSYVLTIPSGYKIAMRFYDRDKNFITPPAGAQGFINNIPSGYVGEGVEYARFILAKTDDSEITPNDMKNAGFQIEVGSAATAYEPYVTPTTHTANLGRTIYGGEVDVVNGTGTDEYTFDLWDGTQNYNVSDNLTSVFRIYMAHEKPLPDVTAVQCICDGYTFPRAGWSSDTVSFYSDANNFTLKLPKTEVTTLEEAKAWLAEHNVTFLYATTPEDFTFTAVPIISRLGDNTMWSDDGDLSVVYRYESGDPSFETVLSSDPLLELTGVRGTDVSRNIWTYTATDNCKIKFHSNTQVITNTSSNDGYFTVKKNDTVIASIYANTSTTTQFPIPDIELESGDTVTITGGFDNYHTPCWFDVYSTITILHVDN